MPTNPADGYSIDSNIVIDGRHRYYPPDVFPSLWAGIDQLIADGGAVVADECLVELERGSDECHGWARTTTGLVVQTEADELEIVREITDGYPDWVSDTANWADPYVIAHAATRGWAVVTNEKWSTSPFPSRIKIPNVCADVGVPCYSFLDLMRAEGWVS